MKCAHLFDGITRMFQVMLVVGLGVVPTLFVLSRATPPRINSIVLSVYCNDGIPYFNTYAHLNNNNINSNSKRETLNPIALRKSPG